MYTLEWDPSQLLQLVNTLEGCGCLASRRNHTPLAVGSNKMCASNACMMRSSYFLASLKAMASNWKLTTVPGTSPSSMHFADLGSLSCEFE
jgi:hypothetical protein